ncbi:hypothetical protein Q1W71_04050 [Flavobacterium pectinovorum]|uniref:hypothetical protein n=1 Tax=Flavobacterium pectinovorum TaxID=29533 RepID=UPI00265D7ED5|nr:hypothetical protein [Flavobacterium pectinovorum]WKL48959.1 hypothetical protein Q1W71_04050 [Flavobacterium pectinovorum]
MINRMPQNRVGSASMESGMNILLWFSVYGCILAISISIEHYYKTRNSKYIVIGADKDADGNPTTADKSWESDQYNWVVLYKNTTYKMSVYKSMSITISY